jgi:hypothetical protein
MVHKTRNSRGFRLRSSFGILTNITLRKLDTYPSSDEGVEDIHSTGSARRGPVTVVTVPETLGSLEYREMDNTVPEKLGSLE